MVCRRAAVWPCLLGIVWGACQLAPADEPVSEIDYSLHVRPILAARCLVCHGPDEGSRQAGLRLDNRSSAITPAESGTPSIVPGEADKSPLINRIVSTDADVRMPPADSGPPLSRQEISILRQWIAAGAPYSEHWSFRPVAHQAMPTVHDATWLRNPIDGFSLARLEHAKVAPSPPPARETLVRRLFLDLLGLPPSPEEAVALNADDHPDAYERLVDRLLASPHFGERFGRHWLDLAHYADSDGYLGDALRPYAWRYRQWVIEAINNDLPLDQFVIQQLAGDLLPDASMDQRTATGFLRNTLRNTEAGVDLEEYRMKEIVDRVSTVGTAWLGLSLGCAECHSHKYDPISHREFYELFSFFNEADDVDLPASLPGLREDYEAKLHEWSNREVAAAAALTAAWPTEASIQAPELLKICAMDAKKRNAEHKKQLEAAQKAVEPSVREVLRNYEQLVAKKPREPAPKVLTIAKREKDRPTYVHLRGDYRSRGERVAPGTPAVLPPLDARTARADRLDLAHWLTAKQNPLTPRVTANYLWSHLFGRGLVATLDNFGVGGETPSHPELLDWLATELRTLHSSRKAIIRRIVTSATYRQSSVTRKDLSTRDPLNNLLARQNRFRLEAESIRDAALTASGLLNRKIGGDGIRPPQPAYVTSISRNADWPVTQGGDVYRRGMYIVFRRATPYPMLLTFDAPDSTFACSRRERTNSPLQSLMLLNDATFFAAAQAIGRDIAATSPSTDEQRLQSMYRQCLGREPLPSEVARLLSLLNEQRQNFRQDPAAAKEACGAAAAPGVAPGEQAAWVMVARVLMNLDEFITRE